MAGIPVKWILIGLAALLIFGVGVTAVKTYQGAIAENANLKTDLAIARAMDNTIRNQIADLHTYQTEANSRAAKRREQISKIEGARSARNEKGDIVPASDNVLTLLNGMFPL